MAQPQLLQIKLSRHDVQPWGFRLQGGVDFAQPLLVQKVNGGSLAEKAGLLPGDAVIRINDVDVFNLRHKDAQDIVVRSGNTFVLTVQRGGSTWRPHVTPTGNIPQPQQKSPYLKTVTKTSLAHKQQDSQHIGCGYNNAARPYANGGDGSVKSIVNKQYNTPVGIYSDESIAETLSAQAEVLAGGVLGVNFKKNEKEYQPDKSEVLKFLREEETGQSSPGYNQDHHHQNQQQQQQQHYTAPVTRHVSAPVNTPKPPSTGELPTGQNICHECERLITGVFVRIKDKNLHVECFKCATCGTSLKNQGYYNYNNKLYCDIHAKLAALQNPPAGTDGYVPVPIKPHTKLSANTISSALNTHGYSSIPVANGGSAPEVKTHQCSDEIKNNNKELPLPPPPSPTLLQQLEIDSHNTGYVEDSLTNIKQQEPQIQHARTNSSLSIISDSSPISTTVYPKTIAAGSIAADEKSKGYTCISQSHSEQTSCSSSSLHGIDRVVNTIPTPPPPPPPLSLLHSTTTLPTQYRQHNENDVNLQNEYIADDVGPVGLCVGGKFNPSGGVYSKFLKEYSNKLLTQNNTNNTHTNTLQADNSISNNKNTNNTIGINSQNRFKDIAMSHQPSTQTPLVITQPTSVSSGFETIAGGTKTKTITKPIQPSVVAALSATFANQLNFNSCQQVAKETPTSQLLSLSTVTTAINETETNAQFLDTINNSSNSNINININSNSNIANNTRLESGEFITESESRKKSNEDINSTMLTNQSPALEPTLNDERFGEYVTLSGSVIRSVVPPGKGVNINYKVNQGYVRPFGANSGPAVGAPKSPVAYPPQRPPVNAYATLPRSNIGQQGKDVYDHHQYYEDDDEYCSSGRRINTYNNYPTQFKKPIASSYGSNKYATMPAYNNSSKYNSYCNQDNEDALQPQYAEECHPSIPAGAEYFEEDHELEDVNRQNRNKFSWPPTKEDSPVVPTAAPLYIPPPETQHAVPKPLKVSQPERNSEELSKEETQVVGSEQQPTWQSKSAPQLTMGLQPSEIESSSESFTSTSTTTTTTTEEYQRMYAAQVQAYQIQQMYDQQSGSELDYHMDLEVANMQQNLQDSSEYISGRRSAQECVESLSAPLNMYKLIDMVREVTPSPAPPSSGQGPRHVVFLDELETKEIPVNEFEETVSPQIRNNNNETVQSESITSLEDNRTDTGLDSNVNTTFEQRKQESDIFIKSQSCEISQSQRIFQPTPEIKIEIAPVRQIPPTKIPNPVPKEWINPMVRMLTTAPDTPFHLVECPCPKPCDCKFESLEPDKKAEKMISTQELIEPNKINKLEETKLLDEVPSKGSRLSCAMTTAPEWEVRFQPPSSEMIPLPEETTPYMPPPIDMKPYMSEDYRPKSPFLSALTTAPERPFESHFDRDVPIHLIDLPTPKEHLTMSDALRTAPEREYTPLNPENATHLFEEQEIEKEKKKYEFQVLDREKELGITTLSSDSVEYYTTENRNRSQQRKSSAFAAMQAFQPTEEPLTSNTARQSITSYNKDQADPDYEQYCKAKERNKKRIDYYHNKEEELQQKQATEQIKKNETSKTNTCLTSSLHSYTKQNFSSESSSAVQINNTSTNSTCASNSTQALRSSSFQSNAHSIVSDTKIDLHEVIEETTEELEHSEVLFPPPSPLSHLRNKAASGLHKADMIPKYQRNWTILPTQSPVRTPEPTELRENVPLAFVDTPVASSISNPVHKPVAQISTTTAASNQQQHETNDKNMPSKRAPITSTNANSIETKNQKQILSTQQHSKVQTQSKNTSVPIIKEESVASQVTMAFQSLEEHLQTDDSQIPSRPYTPSICTTKTVPVIPFYQTPEALCFDECPATHARTYDRRSASPFPDRARSPAPGPPPNPLAAIRSSKPKDNELYSLSPRVLQAGSITTGQSYLGAQQQQQLQQQQHQAQILSHCEQSSTSGSHNYFDKPEVVEEHQIGDYTLQRREKEVHKADQQQSSLESQTKMQVGNTQIERRRRVTEEYEHTQSARSVEIRTGATTATISNPAISAAERRQSYGKTGYVANQARRLSGLEQEITNLTSQSQAISARAATLTETSFPQMNSPEPVTKFPTKPLLPPHDEPERPSYVFSATPYNKMVGPPAGYNKQEQKQQQQQIQQEQRQQQQQLSTSYGASIVSQQQQQQKSLSTYSSSNFTSSTSTASSLLLSSQANANANIGNLTKASFTNNNINQAEAASATGICPVTGTFCRPGHTCCRQQQLQAQSNATSVTNYNQNQSQNNNNVTYRPKASTAELCTKTTNANATHQHKVNSQNNKTTTDAHQPESEPQASGEATAMLAESIGSINMGDKMENFMAEAGKIISNMLEARLANNANTMPTSSHGGSTSSLRSNCSSNQSKSPMVIRKRFDLEDFKNADPTDPAALKPVVTIQTVPDNNILTDSASVIGRKTNEKIASKDSKETLSTDLPTNHPMGKVLDICDSNKQFYASSPHAINVNHLKTNGEPPVQSLSNSQSANKENTNCDTNTICQLASTESTGQPQTVVYRENIGEQRKPRSGYRSGEISTHAMDRRSYIEPNDLNVSDSAREGPAFSINVKALGPKVQNSEDATNIVMSPENEQVVSQLLKDGKHPICCQCNIEITKGPFITALGRIWCPEHFICVNANCRRPLQDIGFVEEKGDLYCEFCFEKYLAPICSRCGGKIKGDCLNAIGKQFHPECFTCAHCGKLFGNTPFFLEDGNAYCEADWNELFTTKCFACGFPVEAGDRWVEALNHNYHSQCFNCTYCKQNLEGQSFYNKGGRPFCKNHAR